MLNIAQAALLVAAFGSGVTAQAALYGQCELSLSTEIPKPRMLTTKMPYKPCRKLDSWEIPEKPVSGKHRKRVGGITL